MSVDISTRSSAIPGITIQKLFEQSVLKVNKHKKDFTRMTNKEGLKIYALYKQSTSGNINTEAPYAIFMEKRAKWDAWNSVKGLICEHAQRNYIQLVIQLSKKYNVN
jgi:diazepam-binding inhibitor (GABA receptor modulating acyl-CoA-binding protein)